eukprot:COSAG01_NODE_10726_length_2094_cov_1.445614_1_plen_98_part_10
MSWGLFIAGFGCFDSLNYLVKHMLFIYLDVLSHNNLYAYMVTPTPFAFLVLLIRKCKLDRLHRIQDIWKSFLFTFRHLDAWTSAGWIEVSSTYHSVVV